MGEGKTSPFFYKGDEMTLSEFRNQIRDLGFEEDTTMRDEYPNVFLNALNRSLDIINTTVKPIVGKVEIIQDGTQTGVVRYDLSEMCPDYEALYGMPTRVYNNAYYTFNNYTLEQNKIILMDASIIGTFTFYYTKILPDITASTADDFEIPIDHEVEQLLPLLTAYYVWLDDDERKAVMYYNQFDSMKQEILQRMREKQDMNKAEIIGGIGWN